MNNFLKIIKRFCDQEDLHSLDNLRAVLDQIKIIRELDSKEILMGSKALLSDNSIPKGASLFHENGFKKISIFKDLSTQLQIRLHFWEKGYNDSSYHNHRWNFLSFLIRGSLEVQNVDVVENVESGLPMYRLEDADSELNKQSISLGNFSPLEITSYQINRGSYHYAHYKQIHRVCALEDSISLMVTGSPKINYSHVLRVSQDVNFRRPLPLDHAIKIIEGSAEI